jgi:type VI secretion system protein ImpF
MAQARLPSALLPSLKDRLLNPESMGTQAQPGYTLSQIIDSVRDDLEDLLNTRRAFEVDEAKFPQLARSFVNFGLPDLTSLTGMQEEIAEGIAGTIEKIIAQHEPRLRNIRATVARTRILDLRVRLHIEADLRVDPAPRVSFETIVELTTGHAFIRDTA